MSHLRDFKFRYVKYSWKSFYTLEPITARVHIVAVHNVETCLILALFITEAIGRNQPIGVEGRQRLSDDFDDLNYIFSRIYGGGIPLDKGYTHRQAGAKTCNRRYARLDNSSIVCN